MAKNPLAYDFELSDNRPLFLIRQTQAAFAPTDTAKQDILRLAKEKIQTLRANEATPAQLQAARDYAQRRERKMQDRSLLELRPAQQMPLRKKSGDVEEGQIVRRGQPQQQHTR